MAQDESADKPESDSVVLGIRMKRSLRDLIDLYVSKDTHTTAADFLRDAAREKIQRDAPHLIQDLMRRDGKEPAAGAGERA